MTEQALDTFFTRKSIEDFTNSSGMKLYQRPNVFQRCQIFWQGRKRLCRNLVLGPVESCPFNCSANLDRAHADFFPERNGRDEIKSDYTAVMVAHLRFGGFK
jgi:hypothetical protein